MIMKKDNNKKTERKKNWLKRIVPLAALIMIIAGFIAYSNSFDASFHWDDLPQLLEREIVHNPANFLEVNTWKNVNLRPLSLLTFSFNYAAGGEQLAGYHLVNLFLHILTSFLVFLLARFTIGLLVREDKLDQRLKDLSALFVALLFLLHPLQTMAVTYIVQRMTILAALFYVLSVFLYAKGRLAYLEGGSITKSSGLIAIAFIAGIMGVLSKQNAATFPAAFILYELFFIRKADGRMCKKYIVAAASMLTLIFLFVMFSGRLPVETTNFTRLEYFSAQLGVFYKYILLVLFPISQNADYFIRVEPPLIGAVQIIGLILILGLTGLGIYLFRKNKLIAFGIFWFLITMSIESSLIPIRDIMMEHRMYLPLFGFEPGHHRFAL